MGKKDSVVNIHSWMLGLGIGGNDLLAYALIFGFSHDGVSSFRGSYEYIAWWLQCERRTAINVVNRLVQNGYVEKGYTVEKGERRHYMYALVPDEGKFFTSSERNARSSEKISPADSENFSPNNTITDITTRDNSIREKYIKRDTPKFDFRQEIINAGVSADTADQWLKIRKSKGLVNTPIALKETLREIAKSGQSAERCIYASVARSWAGFKADWLARDEQDARRGGKPKDGDAMMKMYEALQRSQQFNPDDLPDTPDEQ